MNKDAKILIVEDEPHINRLIELVLISGGYYKIRKAYDGQEALDLINQDKPDLILMDVMIPEINGLALCKIIKGNPVLKSIQVIMLTAKKLEEDVLSGFESGAVNYITKPFRNKILLARINAHLNNSGVQQVQTYKDLELDNERLVVKLCGETINLTHFEFKILELFLNNIDKVFSRSQLLLYLRGNDGFDVSERAVDVQILNLRRKLGDFGQNIETVRGFGYKLRGKEKDE